MRRIIDVHSHCVFRDYLELVARHGALREDGFPLPTDWSIEKQLELMDAGGIEWALVSLSSPHPYFGDSNEAKHMCRAVNESMAEAKRRYPGRIGFGACLPLPDVDAAIEEAVYALDVLGADSIKLASNSRGQYLGDPALEPLMAELDRRGAIVNLHPHRPEPQQEGVFSAGPVPLFEFLCDTTRAVLNMISNGVLERHPDIKVIVPHNGSFLPNIYDRFQMISNILVPQGLMPPVDVSGSFQRLYFDTSGNPVPSLLKFLLTVAEPSHILYGADYPFTPKETVLRNLDGLIAFMEEDSELKQYKGMILYENARRLFHVSHCR